MTNQICEIRNNRHTTTTRRTTARILGACPWKLCLSERVTRSGAKQGVENRSGKRKRETERERERYRCACTVAINIPRRHRPDRTVAEENGEIIRKPPAVRYGRVMLEYRVINFRARRLNRASCRSVHVGDNDSLPFSDSLSLSLALSCYVTLRGAPLVTRVLELQLHEIGETVSETHRPRTFPSAHNIAESAGGSG